MRQTSYPPIGKLIAVNDHRLHIYSTGEGNPTVVFESGGLGWSLDWHLVQTEVAKFTCACSYDRAGFGWSDAGPTPRTSDQIVNELHTLLTKAERKKPYIFVGASFGGHIVRLFTHKHPDEVAGVILLDARHEAINSKIPPAWHKLENIGKGMNQFMLTASRFRALKTIGKLMGEKADPPMLKKLPSELQSIYLEVGFQPKYFQSNLDELEAVNESDKQLTATGSLGNVPLVVIRHGIPEMFARMPADQAEQAEIVWQEMQTDLAKLSSNSQLIVAEKSGHNIPRDQPDLVVDVIRQMIDTIRSE
jgi:pimeloyl-ACP methyl ester carboxylesterase